MAASVVRRNSGSIRGVRWRRRRRRKRKAGVDEWFVNEPAPPPDFKQRESRWRTWKRVHNTVAEVQPYLPLLPWILAMVVAAMRSMGYRSTQNYLSTAKRKHLSANFGWTPSLEQSFRDGMRAARRCLGPPARAAAFSLASVALAFVFGRYPPSNMEAPIHVLLVTALTMMRGIEAAALEEDDVVLDCQAMAVSFRINASKTDIQERGFKFRWRCTCGSMTMERANALTWMLCPFHVTLDAAIRHCGYRPTLGPTQVGSQHKPFFKTKRNSKLSSTSVTRFLRALAAMQNLAPPEMVGYPDEPKPKYSGHSCRRSGAQHWLRQGLPADVVRRLARWRSEAIEAYIEQMPIENLGVGSFKISNTALAVTIEEISREVSGAIKRKMEELGSQTSGRADSRPAQHSTKVRVLITQFRGERKAHLVQVEEGPMEGFKTKCNYKFMSQARLSQGHEILTCEPQDVALHGRLCQRGCFRHFAAAPPL